MDVIYWNSVHDNTPAIKTAKLCVTEFSISDVLHSYSENIKPETFISIIPAGTKYFYNPVDMEYVSEKLIVFKTKNTYLLYKLKHWIYNLKKGITHDFN